MLVSCIGMTSEGSECLRNGVQSRKAQQRGVERDKDQENACNQKRQVEFVAVTISRAPRLRFALEVSRRER